MATKLDEYLRTNKIDTRRLLAVSRDIERLRTEDRAIRLARRLARTGDGAAGAPDPKRAKPRSGRPVTARALAAALAGKPVAGPAKTRILRAVNHVLGLRKKDPVDLRALF